MQYRKFKLPILDSMEIMQTTGSNQAYPAHFHETYCLSVVERGVFVENGLLISSGVLLLTPPGEIHENRAYGDMAYDLTTFYISPDVLKPTRSRLQTTEKLIDDPVLFGQFHTLAHLLLTSRSAVDEVRCERVLKQLSGHLSAVRATNEPTATPPESILDMQQLIRSRSVEKLSVDELGLRLNMSRFQFVRWFRRHTGLTPYDYLLLCRIEQAKKLLAEGQSMVLTALDVGFYDQSHFANTFKRYVGVTPKLYQTGCTIFQDKA